MKKSIVYAGLSLVLCASMILGACSASGSSSSETGSSPAGETSSETAAPNIIIPEQELSEEDKRFDAFCLEEFQESVSTDTLTLHFDVADPAAFGLEKGEATLETIDAEYTPDWVQDIEELSQKLDSFDYQALSEDRQLTWDILRDYVDTELSVDDEKLFYYGEPLQTSSGTHSILPILMTEYTFRSKEDVEDYLALLEDFPRYFGEILVYEQNKSNA